MESINNSTGAPNNNPNLPPFAAAWADSLDFDPAHPSSSPLELPLHLRAHDMDIVIPPLPDPRLLTERGGVPLPRRMATCLPAWRALLPAVATPAAAEALLDGIEHGFRLPIPHTAQPFHRQNAPSASSHAQFVSAELEKYVALGIITPTPRHELKGICSLNVEPQANGPRLVVNGRPLNDQMAPAERFAYEDVAHLGAHLRPNQFMAKADVRRLYLNIPIHPTVQRWVGIEWDGDFYRFVALPLGLSHSPRIATLVMRPLIAVLRHLQVQVTQYLDDGLVAADTKPLAIAAFGIYKQVLARAGLLLHPEKCSPTPTTTIEFLGFQVTTTPEPTISLTARKRAAYAQQARRLMAAARQQRPVEVKKLSRFAGSIASTMRAFLPGLALLRHLNRLIAGTVASGGWRATTTLSEEVRLECRTLRRLLASNLWTTSAMTPPPSASQVLTTDASAFAWGAFLSLPTTPDEPTLPPHQARWPTQSALASDVVPTCRRLVEFCAQMTGVPPPEWTTHTAAVLDSSPTIAQAHLLPWRSATLADSVSDSHNNVLESMAILNALLRYAKELRQCRLWVRSDNMAALAATRRAHSPTSPLLAAIGVKIRLTMEALQIQLVAATHLPGELNHLADEASRKWLEHHRRLEWPICATTLRRLLEELQTPLPELDAFATAANTKCRRFWSLHPDPLADGVDAMAQRWTARSLFLNPPFAMMTRVINKMRAEPPRTAVVVAPEWPNKLWYQQLAAMAQRSAPVPPQAILSGPNATEALTNPKWRLRLFVVDSPQPSPSNSSEPPQPNLPPPPPWPDWANQ